MIGVLADMIKRASGKKFFAFIWITVLFVTLVLLGRITGDQFVQGLVWASGFFFGSQAVTDSASNIVETASGEGK